MQGLRIYTSLVGAGVRSAVQYRANFVVDMVAGLIYQGTGFIFIWVVLTRFASVGGWRLGEMAFLYGLRLLISSMTEIAFPYMQIAQLIRRGEFDRFMVRPFPILAQAMTRRVQVSLFGDLLGGISLFVAAALLAGIAWSPLAVVYLLLALLGGCLVQAALMLVVIAVTFRSLSTGMLTFLIDDLVSTFGNYPLTIYPRALQFVLTFGLPLAFMAYFPATVLLARTGELAVPALIAYLAPLGGLLWFGAAYAFLRREMRHYQSSGH